MGRYQSMETLVAYYSPAGHDHDDNCRTEIYRCDGCGRNVSFHVRKKCPTCNWKGKEECFCHKGKKIEELPNVA